LQPTTEASQSDHYIMAKISPLILVVLAVGLGIVVIFSLVKILVRLRKTPQKETRTPSAVNRDIDCEAALSTHSSMTLVEKVDSNSEWQRFDFGFEEADTFYKDYPKVATTSSKMTGNASITRPEVAHLLTRQSRLSACLPFTALDYDDDRGRTPGLAR
jgi:hypothetical protein